MAQLLSAFRPQAVFSSKSSNRGAALQCSTAKAVAPVARSSLVVEGERSGRWGGPAGDALWSGRLGSRLWRDMRGGRGQWLGRQAGGRPLAASALRARTGAELRAGRPSPGASWVWVLRGRYNELTSLPATLNPIVAACATRAWHLLRARRAFCSPSHSCCRLPCLAHATLRHLRPLRCWAPPTPRSHALQPAACATSPARRPTTATL